MKFLFAATFVVLAISFVGALQVKPLSRSRRDVTTEAPKCKEGDSYPDDCNTCTCNELGLYVCTRRACYDGPQFPDTEPLTTEPSRKRREIEESTGKYDPPKQHSNILSFEIERCTPNEVKNKDCNRCKCTKTGKGFMCTRRACPPALIKSD